MNRQSLVAVSVVAILVTIGIGILVARRWAIGPEPMNSGTVAPIRPTWESIGSSP